MVWLADYEAWGNTAKIIWREEKLESLHVSADELQPIRFQGERGTVSVWGTLTRSARRRAVLGVLRPRDRFALQ